MHISLKQYLESRICSNYFLLKAPVISINCSKRVNRKCRAENQLGIFENNCSNTFEFSPNNSDQIPKGKDGLRQCVHQYPNNDDA